MADVIVTPLSLAISQQRSEVRQVQDLFSHNELPRLEIPPEVSSRSVVFTPVRPGPTF